MPSTDKSKAKRPSPPGPGGGKLESEYGYSSGDRNTRTDEHDWKHFKEGTTRTEREAGREPPADPPRRQ